MDAPVEPSRPWERFLNRRAAWVLAGLVAASISLRIAYFAQLDGGPTSNWHRWENGDPNFFDLWGRRLAAGDWLTDGGFHPLHAWHRRVAWEYYTRHKEEERLLRESGADPDHVLWDRWYGGPLLHQEPLYPYLIGIIYRLFGPDPRWVYALQMSVGVLTNVLIWLLVRRRFGDVPAFWAGMLAVFCGPLLFYEMTLVRTTLTVFASIGLLALFERASERGTVGSWAAAGFGFGAALLLQTTFFLFGVAALAVEAWRRRDSLSPRWMPAAAVAAGVVAWMSPVVVRNAMTGAPLLGCSAVGTVTFAGANWPDTDPTRGWAVDERAMARLMTDTDGQFRLAVQETLTRHDPITFFQLFVKKMSMLLHNYELPNNKNFLYYRGHAPVLWVAFVGFGVILSLALVGLWASWKEPPRPALFFVLVLTSAAPMILFYVLSRFRAPLAAALIPFAGLGIARLAEWLRGRRWKWVGIWSAAILVMFAWMHRPLPPHMRAIRSVDYRVAYRTHWEPRERAAIERGDWAAVASILAEVLAEEPDELRRSTGTPLPEGAFEIRQITDYFQKIHARRAGSLAKQGRTDEAAADSARAEILKRSLSGIPVAPEKN